MLVAAGIGSRLRPLTDVLPKCLMPINGQPLLGLWLKMLRDAGMTEIVVNLHHHADLVREYLRRSPYQPFVTPAFEDNLLGTGGTLLRNKDRLAGASVLFAHADNLTRFDPLELLEAHHHRPPGAAMTMMTFDTDAPQQCGIVELDPRGVVTGFHEKSLKPPGTLANAAIYILEPEVLAFLDTLGKSQIEFSTDVVPRFVGRISTFHNRRYHRDIGSLESLVRAQFDYPLAGRGDSVPESDDLWYGLMSESGGRLARDFAKALDKSLSRLLN